MPLLSLSLLGPIIVKRDGEPITDFTYAKVRALLAYLAVEESRPHQRETLAELLWPDQLPEQNRNSLRRALATLRQTIGDQGVEPPWLLAGRDTIQFNPASEHALDVALFTQLLQACERHSHQALRACEPCAERLEQATALYRGPFLDGGIPRDCGEFEAWALTRREWFERQTIEALEALANYHMERGNHAAALLQARRLLELDPWGEAAHRLVMRALAAAGQRSAALAQFEQCRRVLADELGVEPEPETLALYERIRAAERAPAEKPEPPPQRYRLPARLTSFVGRESELAELTTLVRDPSCRLVTVLGPGGIGKSRLALQLAERVAAEFRHGACWVALASLSSPDDLADAIGRALGVTLRPADDPREALLAFLERRELLLALDNFEHLLDGVELLGELLAGAPRLSLLVTSRERLQTQWEWVYDLPGLAVPSEPDDTGAGAVQLLLERARQSRHFLSLAADERAAAAQIARLVEGMPLALELAAAANREQSFSSIAAALVKGMDTLRASYRDMPDRHRSMRSALEHSWRLLQLHEQHTLARLSVFRGGFNAALAEQVAGAGTPILDTLVDKSLLRRLDGRYEAHELIRQFAYDQLQALGQAEEAHTNHLEATVALAEEAGQGLLSGEQDHWLPRLEREHSNIRAALRWSLDSARFEQAAQLGGALWRFWWMRSHMSEGRRWLDEILSHGQAVAPATLARAARGAGSMANQQNDYDRAREYHTQALELERAVGNQRGIASQLSSVALVATNQGDYTASRALLEEALAIHTAIDNQIGVALVTDGLAGLAHTLGDYPRARALYERSLAMHRARDDRHSIAIAVQNLGDIAYLTGELAVGEAHAREGLALFREIGSKLGEAAALQLLGGIAHAGGDNQAAWKLFAEALPLFGASGNRLGLISGMVGMARLAGAAEQWDRAATLLSAATLLRSHIHATPRAADQQTYDAAYSASRAGLSEAAWEIAWARGEELSTDEALALALEPIGAP